MATKTQHKVIWKSKEPSARQFTEFHPKKDHILLVTISPLELGFKKSALYNQICDEVIGTIVAQGKLEYEVTYPPNETCLQILRQMRNLKGDFYIPRKTSLSIELQKKLSDDSSEENKHGSLYVIEHPPGLRRLITQTVSYTITNMNVRFVFALKRKN